jgi:hypothetical protein
MAVFLLSGLWHGANWTFVIWGALHGFYYVVSRNTAPLRATIASKIGLSNRPVLHTVWQILATFGLVCLAWIFFRAADASTAMMIIGSIGQTVLGLGAPDDGALMGTSFFHEPRFYFAIATVALFGIWDARKEYGDIRFSSLARWQRWGMYYAACLSILLIGNLGNKQFIYFQF